MEVKDIFFRLVGYGIACAIGLCICALFGSCRSCDCLPDITEDMFIHDTTFVDRISVDTLIQHDSISHTEYMKGDTLFITDYKYKYIYKPHIEYRDSVIYKDRTYVATKEVEVEKKLSWWQKFRLMLGNILLVAIVAALVYAGYRIYRRLRV